MTALTTIAAPPPVRLEPIRLTRLPERPLVSVLVSNHNYELYIRAAIQSVVDQTYRNWELIICDDGSTDSSVEVIHPYVDRDSRVQLISKANGGQASGLNAAYAVSSGHIICLLDSDDLFLPTKLEQVVECCRQHPQGGLIVHRVIRVTRSRERKGVWPLSDSLPSGWYGPKMLESGGIVSYMPPTSGLTLRRDVADQLFPLPTDTTVPDQMITRLAPLLTPVARMREPLAEYRLHDRNQWETVRVTVDSLTREISICEDLWKVQDRFLREYLQSDTSGLESLSKTSYWLFLQYLRAKLTNDRYLRSRYTEFIRGSQTQVPSHPIWLWRLSILLPRSIFELMVNLILRQSKLKQLLARAKGLL